uniref:FABP domain-containing protein n=1 Tax=Rhabditophanes sp. KR3021 TaxID=114890 RepID=A0AC35TRF1_9BILA
MTLNDKQKELLGTWKLINQENFEEYLKAIDVGIVKRKLALSITPTLILESDGSNWKSAVISTFKSKDWNFTIGDKQRSETIDDRVYDITMTLTEDGHLIETQEAIAGDKNSGVPSIIERYVDGNGHLVAKIEAAKVVAHRYYARV